MKLYPFCLVIVVGCTRAPTGNPPAESASSGSGSSIAPAMSSPRAGSGSAATSPPHTDTCVKQGSGESPPSADSIAITGDAVDLCFGAPPTRSCWHVDVATQAFTPRPVAPNAPDHVGEPRATAELRPDGSLQLCSPGGAPCKQVANPSANPQPAWVAVSDDLALVALPDAEGPTMRVFDVATKRLRLAVKGWADSPMPGDAFNEPPSFATPDRMIVWYAWTPVSEQGRIVDLSGKQLGTIGPDFDAIGPAGHSWHLGGTEWAIKGEGNTIATVDVAKPKGSTVYDISALLALPRPPPDSDTAILDVLAIAGTADRLILVTGENPVTIGVLDRTTKKLVKLEPPRCP